MKKRILFLVYYGLFWLFFFILTRLIFLIYQLDQSAELPVRDWISMFIHGFRLDLSATSYLLIIPFLATVIHSFLHGNWYRHLVHSYTIVLLIILSFIVVVDMEIYTHWGFRLDKTPLLYITTPKEMMASVEVWTTIRQVGIAIVLFLAGYFIFRHTLLFRTAEISGSAWFSGTVFLVLTASLIIPIRGGFGIAPINTGTAYFHTNPFANHAAINVAWNVVSTLVNIEPVRNIYRFMDEEQAGKIVDALYPPANDPVKVLSTERPNIILLFVESLTSKIIAAGGGYPEVTPQFNRLVHEGIFFSHIYATGNRTDKGVIGVLSGYPSQPTYSIIKISRKNESLPSLTRDLSMLGYSTAYYYGGSIDFANFRSYLVNSRFDRIVSMEDFDPSTYNSKWGVHDHIFLERYIHDLENISQPFFHVVLTLSSHEPFEVPMETKIAGDDISSRFLNSAYYTDKSVGEFIERARQESWWKNTLVILIADHGTRYPNLSKVHVPDRFEIPMLWLGGAVQLKDTVISTYGSQTDIPVTLLNQLGIRGSYPFSKDLLDERSESFAFYTFNDGFGFMADSLRLVFDNVGRKFIMQKGVYSDHDLLKGKAYLQVLFEDFVRR